LPPLHIPVKDPSLTGRPRSPTELDHVPRKPGRQQRVDIIWGNRNPRPHPLHSAPALKPWHSAYIRATWILNRSAAGREKAWGEHTRLHVPPLLSSWIKPTKSILDGRCPPPLNPGDKLKPGRRADRGPCQHRVVVPSPVPPPLLRFTLWPSSFFVRSNHPYPERPTA
jgi:hypothetical protein